jgi:hypothetical protein
MANPESGPEPESKVITTAGFTQPGQIDRSASGLQYQRYVLGQRAIGATLGIGRRFVPEPNVQFRYPPISSAQFKGTGDAKSVMEEEEED